MEARSCPPAQHRMTSWETSPALALGGKITFGTASPERLEQLLNLSRANEIQRVHCDLIGGIQIACIARRCITCRCRLAGADQLCHG